MTLLALIAAAIASSAPHLSAPTRTAYAGIILHAAHHAHVDPVLFVAIIENESHWRPAVVGGSKADPSIGFGQVRLRSYRACRVDLASEECAAVKSWLSTPAGNIAAMAAILKANRRLCGRRVERYLAGYQSGRCRPVKVTWRVLRRWRQLRHPHAKRKR